MNDEKETKMVQINKAQAQTLAMLTRDASSNETWEVEETNIEGVVVLREFIVEDEPDLKDVFIAADGQAVVLGDGDTKTRVLLTEAGGIPVKDSPQA